MATRLLKTKVFVEQLVVRRVPGKNPPEWGPPVQQSKAVDTQINEWVDLTGNEIAQVTAPHMHMQWMDKERTTRLVVATVSVTYYPVVDSVPRNKEGN
jgi:hypothetical protein